VVSATDSPAPLDLDAVLEPGWLSSALTPRYPGVRVTATSVVEELTTIASKVRFRVDYAGARGRAPGALCVKGYFAPQSAQFASLGQTEARFYSEVAPWLPVRVPPCLHTGIDPQSGHGLIIMEDLVAAGCTFLTALSPYSVDQAAATLEQLALLHAADLPAAVTSAGWLAPRLATYLDYVTAERLQALLDDGRAGELPGEVRDARRLRSALQVIADDSARKPEGLVHGDAHAGNLYLASDGAPGLIDWQVVQRGWWAIDVAYHVSAVLDPTDRAGHERGLLAHYLDVRRRVGHTAPSPGEAWDEYRRALAYGYYMWAITQRVERPVVETFVRRTGIAVSTHETFERLGV
jgi:aminoglycoside phosphotransferase (APT) family kinase protein